MRVVILIPAFNAEATLGDVLSKLLIDHPQQDIFVVNDGSTDRTAVIADDCGVQVLTHAENRGKGAALRTGFQRILELKADAVLTLDADAQHDPIWIPDFIRAMHENDLDIVVGSRMHDLKSMPFQRQLSNRTTSKMLSIRCGHEIEDSQCGYRLIRTQVLKCIKLTTQHFDTESEFLLKAYLYGFKIGFIPISTIYNQAGSAIRHVNDTLRFVLLFFRSLFWMMR